MSDTFAALVLVGVVLAQMAVICFKLIKGYDPLIFYQSIKCVEWRAKVPGIILLYLFRIWFIFPSQVAVREVASGS
jgi:hypothetical protein